MDRYSDNQKKYINSVDGDAHMSAVEIIGNQDLQIKEKDRRIKELEDVVKEYVKWFNVEVKDLSKGQTNLFSIKSN